MKKNIQDLLILIIKDSIKDLHLDQRFQDVSLDLTPDVRFGDLSSNIALRSSKLLKKSPLETAELLTAKIKKYLQNYSLKDSVLDVKTEGTGFINFYLSNNYFYEYLKDIIANAKVALRTNFGKGKQVLIEFVSANPTGPLSVAHARQAVVGDALSNILDFLGFKVKREYYLNDEGNQIDILGKSIELRLKELDGQSLEFPKNYYQGEYIYDIVRKIKNQKSTLRLRSGLMVSEVEPSKIKNFSEYGIKELLRIIKKDLKDFGVKFDYWYSQRKLRESSKIKKAIGLLKKKGFLYEQDGALWFKSTQFEDDKDRVVVKSDGSYTYLAPDIAYHKDKYKRGFRWLINLWGPDHHGYINRLKAAVRAIGYRPDSLSIIIVQLATIFKQGKPVQMSTRKGQYITLRDVLDEVGLDAARFFFLMRRTSSHLDFDLDIAKKHTPQNPIYYVQYAHARICSILRNSPTKIKFTPLEIPLAKKGKTKFLTGFKRVDFTLLKEEEELALIKKIWQFSYTLNICYQTLDPYLLTVYLQELAETFHKFYDRHRVLGQVQNLTLARLALIKAVQIVIATGLGLISVSKPEKM